MNYDLRNQYGRKNRAGYKSSRRMKGYYCEPCSMFYDEAPANKPFYTRCGYSPTKFQRMTWHDIATCSECNRSLKIALPAPKPTKPQASAINPYQFIKIDDEMKFVNVAIVKRYAKLLPRATITLDKGQLVTNPENPLAPAVRINCNVVVSSGKSKATFFMGELPYEFMRKYDFPLAFDLPLKDDLTMRRIALLEEQNRLLRKLAA